MVGVHSLFVDKGGMVGCSAGLFIPALEPSSSSAVGMSRAERAQEATGAKCKAARESTQQVPRASVLRTLVLVPFSFRPRIRIRSERGPPEPVATP